MIISYCYWSQIKDFIQSVFKNSFVHLCIIFLICFQSLHNLHCLLLHEDNIIDMFFFQHYTVSCIEVQCCFTSSYCMQFTRWNAFTCQQWPLTDLKLENLLNWRYQIFFQVLIVTIIMNCCFMFDWQKRLRWLSEPLPQVLTRMNPYKQWVEIAPGLL